MLEMETSINKIQITVETIISRQHQTQERISEVEDKIEEKITKKNSNDYNIKEF
jgi:chaperonin cofactor prefoldin